MQDGQRRAEVKADVLEQRSALLLLTSVAVNVVLSTVLQTKLPLSFAN